jgi:glycosyltransferase involved in cell wall biosynthesis
MSGSRPGATRRLPRVLHLVDSFDQGGTERQAVQLARLLHQTGRYDVKVAALSGRGVLREEVERLGLGPVGEFPLIRFHHPSTASQLRRFAHLLRAGKFDLVHAHDFYTNIFGMAAATLARVPVRIASRRETDPGRTNAQRWVERLAFGCAHAVVVNAGAIGEDLVAHGVSARKIYTVYNGVDCERFDQPPAASRGDRLAALGIHEGRPRLFVTIVANLRLALKDHSTFLRAARQVIAAVPDAGFIIAGEGALLEPMRQLATELGLADDVFFTGRCQAVPELLSISDVCVLSSRSEGFPNAIVEYMAARRPVVATAVGGTREAVLDGETGYVVPPGEPEMMAERIVSLLRDPARRAAMGARGREIAVARFSCASQVEQAEQLYQRLLSNAAVSPDNLPSALPARDREAAGGAEDIARRPAAFRAS